MPYAPAPVLQGEDSIGNKLINQGLAYILSGGGDRGERFEFTVAYRTYRGKLIIDGNNFTMQGPQDFSRKQFIPTAPYKTISLGVLQRFLPTAIAANSLVSNGANEIDETVFAKDAFAFVECKSGSAGSSGRQTSSYLQASLEEHQIHPTWKIYFSHCYESDSAVKSDYLYSCLETIKSTYLLQVVDTPVLPARTFLTQAPLSLGASPSKIDTFINNYNGYFAPIALSTLNESARVVSLNYILQNLLKLYIINTYIELQNDDWVKTQIVKLIREEYPNEAVKPHSFWKNMIDALSS
jgi:hypothetical protein